MPETRYTSYKIVGGPSKWDFFLSLADGVADSNRRTVSFSLKDGTEILGYIVRIERMGDDESRWWFVISVTAAPPIHNWTLHHVEGEFNTHTREGYFRRVQIPPVI